MARLGQKELASRLGLSQATVSAVLNKSASIKISEKTRQRVLEAANQAGYWPNRAASALLSRKTQTIGIMHVANLLQTLQQKLYHAVTSVIGHQYIPLIQEMVHGVQPDYAYQYMRDNGVDGVVIINLSGKFTHGYLEKYFAGHVPVVAVDCPDAQSLPQFNSDRHQGFYEIARHLVATGRRRIAILRGAAVPAAGCHLFHQSGVESGARHALAEAGLEPIAVHCYQQTDRNRHNPYLGGEEAFGALMDEGVRPDAVICSDDAWAIGAMSEASRRGIAIPDDIAFTGFHDEVQARYAHVPLTTCRTPISGMISAAVECLLKLSSDGEVRPAPFLQLFDCTLVPRASTLGLQSSAH